MLQYLLPGGIKKQLAETQKKNVQRIQDRRKKIQELRQAVESHKSSAQAAVRESERIFTELIHFIEKKRSKVTELIRAQETAAVSRAEELLKQLEQEIAELRRRDAELEQLSHTEETIHFLQNIRSLSVQPGSEVLSTITLSPVLSFKEVAKSVFELRNKLGESCEEQFTRISSGGKLLRREDFTL
ncbi:hypothetical protein NFI96_010300 [Prochilodus magdalenae]|nr:hypothetical protein NFI96_010300 [Prochilodus magdalenae]